MAWLMGKLAYMTYPYIHAYVSMYGVAHWDISSSDCVVAWSSIVDLLLLLNPEQTNNSKTAKKKGQFWTEFVVLTAKTQLFLYIQIHTHAVFCRCFSPFCVTVSSLQVCNGAVAIAYNTIIKFSLLLYQNLQAKRISFIWVFFVFFS